MVRLRRIEEATSAGATSASTRRRTAVGAGAAVAAAEVVKRAVWAFSHIGMREILINQPGNFDKPARGERGGVLAVGDVEDLLGDALRSLLTRGRPRLISIEQRLAQLAAGIRDLQHVQGVLKNPSSSAMPSPAAGGRGVRTSLWGVADRRVQAAASFSLR